MALLAELTAGTRVEWNGHAGVVTMLNGTKRLAYIAWDDTQREGKKRRSVPVGLVDLRDVVVVAGGAAGVVKKQTQRERADAAATAAGWNVTVTGQLSEYWTCGRTLRVWFNTRSSVIRARSFVDGELEPEPDTDRLGYVLDRIEGRV